MKAARSLLLCDKRFLCCIFRCFSLIAFTSKHSTLTLKMTFVVFPILASLLLVGRFASDAVCHPRNLKFAVPNNWWAVLELCLPNTRLVLDRRSDDLPWEILPVQASSSALSQASPCHELCHERLGVFFPSSGSFVSPERRRPLLRNRNRTIPLSLPPVPSLFSWLLSSLKVSLQLLSPEMSIPSNPFTKKYCLTGSYYC